MLIEGKIELKDKRKITQEDLKDYLNSLNEAKLDHDEMDLDAELNAPIDYHSKSSLE